MQSPAAGRCRPYVHPAESSRRPPRMLDKLYPMRVFKCTRTCSWQMPAMVPPSRIMKTPAATAASASPACRPLAARCVATSEEEQAVCVARQGPARRLSGSRQYRRIALFCCSFDSARWLPGASQARRHRLCASPGRALHMQVLHNDYAVTSTKDPQPETPRYAPEQST